MSRRSRRNARFKAIRTEQFKQVQGPQLNNRPPETGTVEVRADLNQKYLGTGMVGFGPTLEVITTRQADDLIRQHGYDLYRRMLMDSEVDASVDTLVQAAASQPVLAIPGVTEDEEGYQQSKELADFVNWTFERLGLNDWQREQARGMLAFGNAVSEIDWEYAESGPWSGHLYICRLRKQEPENYGFIVDRWGTVYGVAPLGLASGTVFPLGNIVQLTDHGLTNLKGAVPRYKLSVWTWEMRGTDPRGTSALIPAYIPWWSKQRAIEEWSCWLGRYAQASLWATPGPDAVPLCVTEPNGKETITQPTELLLQALLNFKSGSVLALPYGSRVEVLQPNGGASPFFDSIAAFNKEITRAILGQHLATGEGETQSRAAAEVHTKILRLFVNSLRRYVLRQIEIELVKPLIEANYGDVGTLMPRVMTSNGSFFNLTPTEIAVLMQSGYFSADQLQALDAELGVPIRTTLDRVGAGNLPPAILTNEPANKP